MKKDIYLSVVMSQYNELKNLKKGVINEVYQYMVKQPFNWEIVIVDDGSTDGSIEYSKNIKLPNVRYIYAQHSGKAGGLNRGITEAQGKWILVTDVDQSTPITELEKLLAHTSECEVIIGSRLKERKNSDLVRKLASFFFSTFRKFLILGHISDTQCGFKLFKAEKLKKLFPMLEVLKDRKNKGWKVTAFDVELLFMFEKSGYKVREVTVKWFNEDISDSKDRKFVKESLDMLKQISITALRNLAGKYNHLVSKD